MKAGGSVALLRLSKDLNLLDIQLIRSHCLPRQVCPLYQFYGTSKRFGRRRNFPRTRDSISLIEQAVKDSRNKDITFCGLGVGVNSSYEARYYDVIEYHGGYWMYEVSCMK
jgi:hypothetical protein